MYTQLIFTAVSLGGVPHNQHVNEIVTDMCISPLQLHPRIWNSKIIYLGPCTEVVTHACTVHGRVLVNPEKMCACIK